MTSVRWRRIRREARREEGGAAVEMALYATLLLALLLPMVDVAQLVITGMRLDSAVRAGAQYAVNFPTDTAGTQSVVQQASPISATANATISCECNGTSQSCALSCGGTLAKYMTISGSYNVPMIMGSGYPGLTNPYPVSRQTIIRVE